MSFVQPCVCRIACLSPIPVRGRRASMPGKERWTTPASLLCGVLLVLSGSIAATADINKFGVIQDPNGPGVLYVDSGEPCADGVGVNAGPGVDLSDRDLSHAYLYHADLSDALLTGADFSAAYMVEATLSDANLDGATCNLAVFYYATLTNASLVGANLGGARLSEANMSGANLTRADLFDASLSGGTLTNANLTDAILQWTAINDVTSRGFTREQLYSTASYKNGDLTGVLAGRNNLDGWDFSNQTLKYAQFYQSSLRSADLSGADASNVYIDEADCAGVNLSGANLTNLLARDTNFRSANLAAATLVDAEVAGCDFRSANFTAATLVDANMAGCDFSQATFVGANAAECDLIDAALVEADLRDADFSESYLDGADFTDAQIQGASFAESGLSAGQLYSTKSYKDGTLQDVDLSYSYFDSLDISHQNCNGMTYDYSYFDRLNAEYADLRNSSWINCAWRTANFNGARLPNYMPRVTIGDECVVDLPPGTLVVYDEVLIDEKGTLTTNHDTTLQSDQIINAGQIQVTEGASLTLTACVKGTGDTTGHVVMNGSYAPGNSPALVTHEDLAFSDNNTLIMEIGGLDAGNEHDKLVISQKASLGGILLINFVEGFQPSVGDRFDLFDFGNVVEGEFREVLMPGGVIADLDDLYQGGSLRITGVPEPGSWVLLTVLLSTAVVLVKRKAR